MLSAIQKKMGGQMPLLHPLATPLCWCMWQSLVSSLQQAEPVSIPRCYFDDVSSTVASCHLLGLRDTSKMAYAAVVYLSRYMGGTHFTRFVACKTRVSPPKKQIPRLELLSALAPEQVDDERVRIPGA